MAGMSKQRVLFTEKRLGLVPLQARDSRLQWIARFYRAKYMLGLEQELCKCMSEMHPEAGVGTYLRTAQHIMAKLAEIYNASYWLSAHNLRTIAVFGA